MSAKNWNWSVILASALASMAVACVAPDEDGAAGTDPGGADQAPQADPAIFVVPLAMAGGGSVGDQGKGAEVQFANLPTISPPTDFVDISPGGSTPCPSGNFCAGVPIPGGQRVFKLFFCNTYSVSFWNGTGGYLDNQTGNPATRLLDQRRVEIKNNPSTPSPIFPGGGQQSINWTPVWFVKNC